MVNCARVWEAVEGLAPAQLAEEWDNVGLLVGSPARETARVLVALDVTDAVVSQAIRLGAGCIVAHHPILFRGIKSLRTDTAAGARLKALLVHDIAVIAAHTNLDRAAGGVNDVLAAAIALSDLAPFAAGEGAGLGRVGRLSSPISLEAFARHVRGALPGACVRFVRAGAHRVFRVALCSGSGASFLAQAAAIGADTYLTGDVRYHEAQQAAELGIHLVDAGHFGTEFPVVAALAARLRALLVEDGVEVFEDAAAKDIFTPVE